VPAVSSRITDGVHILGDYRTIRVDSDPVRYPHGMAGCGVDELLLACELEQDRTSSGEGQVCRNVLIDFLLVAKGCADARLDDTDAALG